MGKKAQAGMEYLITYGWALILITSVLGVLVFVVVVPSTEITFTSSDPTKFLLKAGRFENGLATIKLQNITGGEIKLNSLTESGYENCEINDLDLAVVGEIVVGSGGEITIECTVIAGEAKQLDIEYTNQQGLTDEISVTSNIEPMSPGGEVICDDGLDNDFDGDTDCADTDCMGTQLCPICGNGVLEGPELCDSLQTVQCPDASLYYSDGYVGTGQWCSTRFACNTDCTWCITADSCELPSK